MHSCCPVGRIPILLLMTRVQIAIFLKVNDITQAIFRSNFGVTNEGVLLFSCASDTRLNDFNSVSPI